MRKKYTLSIVLLTLLLITAIPALFCIHANAQEKSASTWGNTEYLSKNGLYRYYLSNDKASVKIYYYEGSWDITKLVIPSKIDGYKVTAIGNNTLNQSVHPFSYLYDSVKKIVVPDSVVELEEGIFSGMKKLQEIQLPEHIKELPNKLFCECSNLNTFKFPKMLEKIGDNVFAGTAFTKIVIPDTVYSIGKGAFASEKLQEIILPEGIKEINSGTFWASGLKEIKIPDSVTSIGDNAFTNCKRLKNIVLGKNIDYIGWDTFRSTPWLLEKANEEYVMVNNRLLIEYNGSGINPVIPEGTTAIASSAFKNTGICSIIIPDTVTYIGQYAFSNCQKLAKVVLSNNLKTIEASAFWNCAIKEITIPDSVTKIDEEAFAQCSQLYTINFGKNLIQFGTNAFGGTPWLTVEAAKDFVMVNHSLLKYNGVGNQPVIPTGTVSIAGGAFKGVVLNTITIPETVQSIGDYAFGYTQLKSIYFEGNAPEIGTAVFTSYDSNENPIHPKIYYKKGCIGYDTDDWKWYQPSDDIGSVTEKENTSSGKINSSKIKIDKKHFPDKYFRCFITIYDDNQDGYLSQEETDKITGFYYGPDAESHCLDVDSTQSIKGIENFKNLQSITIISCPLKKIDLSKNVKLISIYTENLTLDSINVSGCKKLKSIKLWDSKINKLDVSKNKLLKTFHCQKCTFKSIKLNSNLRELSCSGSNLSSLGINKLSKLEVFHCENCKLSSLSLNSFRKLEELYCGDNKLSKLDISKNTNLRILDCNNNQLTKITFGKAANLDQLDCSYNKLSSLSMQTIININDLNCANNELTNLDVTSNIKLEKLNTSNQNLKSLDISKNNNLQSLICTNNALNYLDLSQNVILDTLNCSDNSIQTLELAANKMLVILTCNNNQLEKLNLSNLTILEELYCDNNKLSALDLSKNFSVIMLYCNKNQFTSLDVSTNSQLLYFSHDENVTVTGWPKF